MNVFNLEAILNLNSDGYTQGLNNASEGMNQFSTASIVKGQLIADAIEQIAEKALDLGKAIFSAVDDIGQLGDTIDKQSQKLGISNRAYQEWSFILQHAGSDISTLRPAMKTLSAAVSSNAEEFKKLGLSMEEVGSMSEEELFSAVISKLQDMKQGTDRNAVASKLLGRAYMELSPLLNMTSEETDDMRKSFEDLGGVMSDEAVKQGAAYEDTLLDMRTAMEGTKREILGGLVPSMTELAGQVTKFVRSDAGKRIANNAKNAITKIFDALKKVDFEKIIGNILDAVVNFTNFVVDNFDTIVAVIKAIGKAWLGLKIIESIKSITKRVSDAVDTFKKFGSRISGITSQMSSGLSSALTGWTGFLGVGLAASVGFFGVLIPKIKEWQESTNEETQRVKALNKAINDEYDAMNKAQEARNKEIDGIVAQSDHLRELADELGDCVDENGNLKESEQARAEFILGELNEALGTEYELNDLISGKYAEIKDNIYAVIDAQRAKAILSAYEEEYAEAVNNSRSSVMNLHKAESELSSAEKELNWLLKNNSNAEADNSERVNELRNRINELRTARDTESEAVRKNSELQALYETAKIEMQKGNYAQAEEMMKNYRAGLGLTTDAQKRANELMAKDTQAWAVEYARSLGVAEDKAKEIAANLPSYLDCSAQMRWIGEQAGLGFSNGLNSKLSNAASLVGRKMTDIISTAAAKLKVESPSKVFRSLGEYTGEGYEIGAEESLEKARETIGDLLTFDDSIVDMGDVAVGVSGTQTAQTQANLRIEGLLNTLIAKLDGLGNQQIILDTGVLVGQTASKMDMALGSLAVRNGRSVFV